MKPSIEIVTLFWNICAPLDKRGLVATISTNLHFLSQLTVTQAWWFIGREVRVKVLKLLPVHRLISNFHSRFAIRSRCRSFSKRKPCKTMISGSLSPRHGASSGCRWRNGLRIWRVAANTLNKQSRTAEKGWSSSLVVGRGANNSSPYKIVMLRNRSQSLGPGLILWYNLSNGQGTWDLESPRRRWEDNIKMDLQEVGWGHGLDWYGLG
jgi:hypothetical protein